MGRWFSPGTPASSTNKTDRHNITEILWKVVLNTITLTPFQLYLEQIYIYIYIYTTSEKPVNDQSYGVLDRYGITILYK